MLEVQQNHDRLRVSIGTPLSYRSSSGRRFKRPLS